MNNNMMGMGSVPQQPGQQVYPGTLPPNQYTQQYGFQPPPQSQLGPSQHEQLRAFWQGVREEVQQVGNDTAEFKNHQLPLARIKKIMKSDEDVRMISAEAPVLFAKACEMFILELTLRSWIHSEENKRRTLQRNDIAAAITKTDIFDFLVDIVPREEIKQEGQPPAAMPLAAAPAPAAGAPPPHPMAGMYYGYGGLQVPAVQPPGGEQLLRPALPLDPASLMAGYQQQQFLSLQGAQQWAHNSMNAVTAAAVAAAAAQQQQQVQVVQQQAAHQQVQAAAGQQQQAQQPEQSAAPVQPPQAQQAAPAQAQQPQAPPQPQAAAPPAPAAAPPTSEASSM